MKLRRHLARDLDPQEYLDGANTAFGHWGDAAQYAWAFRDDAEILLLDDEQGRTIAGSGITFRRMHDGRGVAIVTGSWTLAAARGRGAFTQLINATREIAKERDASALGFVRAENESARRLFNLGTRMQPAFYCRSTGAGLKPGLHLDTLEPDPNAFASSFAYTPREWRVQFMERPNAAIECVGIRGAWSAVVEASTEFDRVHAVSDDAALPLLAARAHARGRRLFWYTTRQPSMDCEWTDGFVGEFAPAVVSDWVLQNGDRM